MGKLTAELKEKLRDYEPTVRDQLLERVPTEPGFYTDRAGDRWELRADGHWYDEDGDTEDPAWNWVLGANGYAKAKPEA
jgi:hypothetical protein